MSNSYNERLESLLEDIDIFDEWTEKYEYIISQGRKLAALPEQHRQDANLIQGCQSRVWVGFEWQNDILIIHADSDSVITKGLIALYIRLLSGLSSAEINSEIGRASCRERV